MCYTHSLSTHTLTHSLVHFQEMDDIVNTIQETWDGDVDARLSSQCVCERLTTFASKFESTKEKDSGFSPSEFDTAEVSSQYQADVNVHTHVQKSSTLFYSPI